MGQELNSRSPSSAPCTYTSWLGCSRGITCAQMAALAVPWLGVMGTALQFP